RLKKSKTNIFFFFPYYHTGGGEQVHIRIIETVREHSPLCFITNQSENSDLKEDFSKVSTLIELKRWSSKASFRVLMYKKISAIINARDNAVVFGCNSEFYLGLLPYLQEQVRKIDLMHAFLGDNQYSFENYSLPVVNTLDNRVVLGPIHREKLLDFYKKKHIYNLNDKILTIPNSIPVSRQVTKKDFSNNRFEILFVGRNSEEKRPHLFIKIAEEAIQKALPFSFTMIGDFETLKRSVNPKIHIVGKINDKRELDSYYEKAHFIMITSHFEGFPMVLLEGMSKGVIPICTDVGEIPGYINEEKGTGYIINNNSNEEKIIQRFLEILSFVMISPQTNQIFSLNVQKLVENEFNELVFKKKYRKLLLLN